MIAGAAALEAGVQGLRADRLGDFKAASEAAACLTPLLDALGWRGDLRHVMEALPHLADHLDLDDLCGVLANLGFEHRRFRVRCDAIDPRLMPCVLVPARGPVMVALRRTAEGLVVFDGATRAERTIARPRGRGLIHAFRRRTAARPSAQAPSWTWATLRRHRDALAPLLAMTLALNVLSLALPLFSMAVYDRVIAGGSIATVQALVLGVAIALATDLGFRALRNQALSAIGSRLEMLTSIAVLRRILLLPPAVTERTPIGAQIARLREFDRLREVFAGPIALAILDLPFVAIYVAAIAVLGGIVATVPVALMLAYVIVIRLFYPQLKRSVQGATQAAAQRQSFIVETLAHLPTIRAHGAEAAWVERFRAVSAEAALAQGDASRRAAVAQAFAQVMMVSSGVATLALGSLSVMDATMSVGALVATMALTWRALAPLNTLLVSLGRIEQASGSLRHVDSLMRLAPERDPAAEVLPRRHFAGRLSFARVSFRYTPDSEPALAGVSFDVAPGELIALVGANSSGKSTVLKLLAGLYQPQAGTVAIDGDNIRQIDPIRLRQSIGVMPQSIQFLHGTIAQNMRLAEPAASDEDLAEAARDAGALDDILALPEGFATRLDEATLKRLPEGMKQRLGIARALVRRPSVLLLDEPSTGLDNAGDAALQGAIQALRGRTTILMVTHRPSHMRLADRVFVFEAGQLVRVGPPATVLPTLTGRTP